MTDSFFKDSVNSLRPYKVSAFDIWSNNINYLKLDWNESTIPPTPMVSKAVTNLINNKSLNWYPPLLNEKLINLLADYCNVGVENVQYFSGSDSLHEYLIQTCVAPDDTTLIISPTYDNFRVVVESYGSNIVNFNLQNDFILKKRGLIEYLKEIQPKIVYICNPNNPTGTVYPKDYCERLINEFSKTLFIFDEAYYEFSGVTVSSLVSKYNNFIISRTFSKAFGLASFRIGYAIGPREIIETINKVRNPKSITHISQIAAIEALKDIDYMLEFTKEVKKSRQLMEKFFEKNRINYISGKGNYIMIKADNFDKDEIINHLFKENILVRDLGHLNQLSNYFRITLGTLDQMTRVTESLNDYLKKKK